MTTKQEIQSAWEIIGDAKNKLAYGLISYDEAKKRCERPLLVLNAAAEMVALKHKMKHYPLTFAKVMR